MERRVFLNTNSLAEYSPSGIMANMMAGARPIAGLDAHGDPTSDFSTIVMSGYMRVYTAGLSVLTFNGSATSITFPNSSVVVGSVSYDAGQNLTTLPVTINPTTSTGDVLQILVTGTKRTANSSIGTGVTNVKWQRPTAIAASTAHPIAEVYSRKPLAKYGPFAGLRVLNLVGTNDYPYTYGVSTFPQTMTTISKANRKLPGAMIQGPGAGVGQTDMALELINGLCNAAGSKDCWLPVPDLADDSWVLEALRIARWGSDGTNAHTGPAGPVTSANPNPQPSGGPLYVPLAGKLHLEWGNETSFTYGFPQFQRNIDAAKAYVAAAPGTTDLDWDGATDQYVLARRRIAQQTARLQGLAEQVFPGGKGTSYAIMLMCQDGNLGTLQPMLDYFDHLETVTGRAMSSYVDYGGHAFYEHLNSTVVDGSLTVDQLVGSGIGPISTIGQVAAILAPRGVGVAEYEGLLNSLEGDDGPTSQAVTADIRFARQARESLDRNFRAGANIIAVFQDCGASWGLGRNNDDPSHRFDYIAQGAIDWANNPTDGTLTTEPLPPLGQVTGVTIPAPIVPLIGGTTLQFVPNVVGVNGFIPTLDWVASTGYISSAGLASLPAPSSSSRQITYTARSVSNPGVSGSVTITVPAATGPAAPIVLNSSFEDPAGLTVGNNQINVGFRYPDSIPSGNAWIFTGAAGLAVDAADIARSNAATPFGNQLAFIELAGSISQAIAGWAAGSYTLAFQAAQRADGSAQVLQVQIDGVTVATITPGSTAWASYMTPAFTVAAGTHTIAIVSTSSSNYTALIDNVTLTLVGSATPVIPQSVGVGWIIRLLCRGS